MEMSTQINLLVATLYLVKQRKVLTNDLYRSHMEDLLSVLHLIMQDKKGKPTLGSKAMQEMLTALREAREDLVSRSINEEPQLFSSFFQYENNENLLKLSFEREYSVFINTNLEKFSSHISEVESVNTQIKLRNMTEEFISFKQSKSRSCINTFFLDDKVKKIEKIFSIFDTDIDRLKEINYIRRKDQVLFDREFERLLRKENELDN
ncbi:hypothetical protein AB4165_06335 [Vibrio cyclitrophicus]|nr:hypothetical protein BCV36_21240 [Vibrio cyclitrophicus]PME57892.1 hypothetical protein BCV37_22115 [Vibrio cyclitrophicus]